MANPQAQEFYNQAQQSLQSGDEIRAYNLLVEALEADHDFLDAWVQLAGLADEENKPEILARIQELAPEHPLVTELTEDVSLNDLLSSDFQTRVIGEEPQAAEADLATSLFVPDDDDATTKKNGGLPSLPQPLQNVIEPLRDALRQPANAELVPGIRHREARLYALGLGIFTLFICAFTFVVIGGSRGRAARANQEATEAVLARTRVLVAGQTQAALEITEEVLAVTASAVVTMTPPTRTPVFDLPTTLPPTATATESGAQRVAPLPPPDLIGTIIGWGGNNPSSRDFLLLRNYDLAQGTPTRLGTDFVEAVTVDREKSRYVYRSLRSDGSALLASAAADNPTESTILSLIWASQNVRNERDPSLSADGRFLTFIADAPGGRPAVFRYEFANQQLIQLTHDGFEYAGTTISPDGLTVVTVRDDGAGADLYMVDVSNPQAGSFPLMPLTSDGAAVVESSPSFAADGVQVVYSAAQASDPDNHDIYLLSTSHADSGQMALATAADEIHPVLDPQGRYVAYAANPTGSYDVFIYDILTSSTFQLTFDERNPNFPGGWTSQ